MSARRPFEDLYPLSPMQRGILYHALRQPGSGVYVCQTCCRLDGDVDAAALEKAWSHAVDLHPALRTAFDWQRRQEPFQIVYRRARMPFAVHDWRQLDAGARELRLEALLEDDRNRGFDLARPPLLRCTLVRTRERRYRFVWTCHHLIIDGWCQGVLLGQIFAAYRALVRGNPPPAVSVPPYRHYIAWLGRREKELEVAAPSTETPTAEDYWRRRLRDFDRATPLAFERPWPPVEEGYDERLRALDPRLGRDLQDGLRNRGLTLATLAQGLWGLLLARRAATRDVVFGSVVSGRPAELPGVESIVGLFVNTLPVRLRIEPEQPLDEWLAVLQEEQTDARRYEHTPLVDAQAWSGVTPGAPLFDSLLVVETFPMSPDLFSGSAESGVEVGDLRSFDRVSYPLCCQVLPGEAPVLKLKFETERFDGDAMAVALEQLAELFRQAAQDLGRPLEALSLRGAGTAQADPAALLEAPPQPTVADLFGEAACRYRERPAIVWGERRWTYGELEATAHALAADLAGSGHRAGEPVAVTGAPRPGRVAAMLAVLLAGGILVTLDPRMPAPRRRRMLSTAGARWLLAVGGAGSLTAGGPEDGDAGVGDLQVLTVDPGVPAAAGAPRPAGPAASDPAYIFFTSGTTGEPRAVLGRHAGLSHFLLWQRETFSIGPEDRIGHLTGLSFDVVLRDVFLPLVSGAVLHVPTFDELSAARVLPWLDSVGVSALHTVPALVHDWLESADAPAVALAALRWVFFAGEPLTDTLVSRFRTAFPGVGEVVNLYGPTETTLAKCWYRLPRHPAPGVQPVGRPLPRTQALVRAPSGRLCGVGEPGEIVLRTPMRTAGLFVRGDVERGCFEPNPATGDADDLLYATGDLGRLRFDGELEILGRLDHQVKIRGVRVEPAEVSRVLEDHPEVASAVVLGRPAAAGVELVAYLVAHRDGAAGDRGAMAFERLRRHLARYLPPAAIPTAFAWLDRLPLGVNGKVDRRKLAELEPRRAEDGGSAPPEPPRGATEEVLAAVWERLLGRAPVGRHDDFFALGGHSLTAAQVVSRVRAALELEVDLDDLFAAPTVAGLAGRLEGRRRDRPPPPITAVPRDAETPLSFAQERLWFHDRLAPGSAAYNLQLAGRLRGALDPAALTAALGAVLDRHEVLRTGFTDDGGRPRLTFRSRLEPELPRIDLRRLGAADREDELRRQVRQQAARPFDLSRPPLLRCLLLLLAERRHALILTLHHIVADAWSLGLLVRDLARAYGAVRRGRAAPLPPLPFQVADVAAAERRALDAAAIERGVAFWRQRLAPAPPLLALPTDRPRPPAQSFRGRRRVVIWPASLGDALRDLARRLDATLFMVLLAGLQTLLARLAGTPWPTVGTALAGRHREETEDLVGFFVDTLALPGDVSGDPRFDELVGRARAALLAAVAHRDVPFERLVEGLGVERNLARNPIFQVLLILQNAPVPETIGSDLELELLETDRGAARLDLTLSVSERDGGLAVLVDFASDLFDATTVQRWLDQWRRLCAAAVDEPRRRLSELPRMAPGEAHQVTSEWGLDPRPYALEVTLHRLFEAQVDVRPAAEAIVEDARRWTYGELEEQANRLAHHLLAAGLGRCAPGRAGGILAVVLERSAEMVAAVLGILKAGAAYLPLDPEMPAERLELLLTDAGAGALLSRGGLLPELPAWTGRRLLLDREAAEIAGADPRRPQVATRADDLAYLIYTSGSTGLPNGVLVPHRGVVNTLRWRHQSFDLAPSDSFLQNISLSFDPSVWQIFGALMSGARLVLAGRDEARDPALLVRRMDELGVTIADFPPSLLRQLLQEPGFRSLSRLRHVFAGGETLSPAVRERFLATSGARLHNIYGPTEASIDATCFTCAPRAGVTAPVPIGRPIANKHIRVLDPGLGLQPLGVVGELVIGGAGLAWGYRRRPARTAERWVPDPWGEPGARLYRTGDLSRFRRDGAVDFLGRVDHQVKIRGVRIEPEEVERVLVEHPSVAEAVVMPRPGARGDARLEAWVTAGEREPEAAELFSVLERRLPRGLVPAVLRRVEAIPRTPAGKVDRPALLAAGGVRLTVDRPQVAPRTREEAVLAEIWSSVLGVGGSADGGGRAGAAGLGIDSNFFELGGDSILSIQIVARAARRGLRITPRQVFEHQTVAELAAVATPLSGGGGEQGPVVGPVALTPIQSWFLDPEPRDPHHFNQSLMVALERPPGVSHLRRATALLLAHHDALRLRFERTAEGWRQRCAPPSDAVPVTVVELGDLAGDYRCALERCAAEAQRSLDPARGPILRAVLFRLGDGSARLLVTVHHLAIDGVSWRLLMEDMGALLDALEAGRPCELPAKTTSFRRWSSGLAELASSPLLLRELEHWRGLPPRPVSPLPTDLAAAPGADLEAAVGSVAVRLASGETGTLLREVPAAARARVDEVLLAALVRALAGHTGDRGARIELEGHGRESEAYAEVLGELDLSRTVGWLTSLYPVYLPVEGAGGQDGLPGEAMDTLGAVRRTLRAIPAHGLGYGVLRYLAAPEVRAELASQPAPEVAFNYLGRLGNAGPGGGRFGAAAESDGPLRSPRWRRPYRLEISASIHGGELHCRWRYSRRLYRRATVATLAARHLEAVREVIEGCRQGEAPAAIPGDFPLLRADQQQLDRLMSKFTGPGSPPSEAPHD